MQHPEPSISRGLPVGGARFLWSDWTRLSKLQIHGLFARPCLTVASVELMAVNYPVPLVHLQLLLARRGPLLQAAVGLADSCGGVVGFMLPA